MMDLSPYFEKPDRLRTHKEIADAVVAKIAELGEKDRALHIRSRSSRQEH